MPEHEGAFRIVISAETERARSRDTGALMTRRTELPRLVTVGARSLAAISLHGMAGQEGGRMKARAAARLRGARGSFGPVAGQTLVARVTGHAPRRSRGGLCTVPSAERRLGMGHRRVPGRGRAPGPSWPSHGHPGHRTRQRIDMTRFATCPGVTSAAGCRAATGHLAMADRESFRSVRTGRARFRAMDERTRVAAERLDGGLFGCIDMALDAEIARVARGTAGGDPMGCPGAAGRRGEPSMPRWPARQEPAPPMGVGGRERRHAVSGESAGGRERAVAHGTGTVRCQKVITPKPVTLEALRHTGPAHAHPWLAGRGMAIGTPCRHATAPGGDCGGVCMDRVDKAQVGSPGRGVRGAPCHPVLGESVMTHRASGWLWPQRCADIGRAGMTRRTERKEVGMPGMIETRREVAWPPDSSGGEEEQRRDEASG